MKAKDLLNILRAKLNIRPVRRPLPNIYEAGGIAVGISEVLNMSEKEQAYFVAGFQECVKYIKGFGNVA